MLRWVLLAQAVIYLIAVPLIKERYIYAYQVWWLVSAAAVFALFVGIQTGRKPLPPARDVWRPHAFLVPGMIAFAVLYCYFSFSFDLLNRRLGSELMAETFANLPLPVLLVIRTFEIVIVPVAALVIRARHHVSRIEKVALLLTVLIAIPFMGLADSRGRLLVLALSIFVFLKPSEVRHALKQSTLFYTASAVVVSVFAYMSFQRAQYYARSSEYYINELINRLDGLNLAVELRDYRGINLWGTFDWNMFSFLVSKLPFLEEAQRLKQIGTTSTKQYYLKEVLGSHQLDTSNSMVTDPLYFGGIAMLVICFSILGYALARFDKAIQADHLLDSPSKAASMFAFGLSFLLFETDFVGALANMILIFIITYALVRFGGTRLEGRDQWADSGRLVPAIPAASQRGAETA